MPTLRTHKQIKELQNHPVLLGFAKGGRKTHNYIYQTARETLHSAAIPASSLLREFIIGKKVKKISRTKLDACIFILEQVIGKAKIKVEHDIGNLTYDALVRLATEKQKLLEAGKLTPKVDMPPIDGEWTEQFEVGGVAEGKNEE